jgi:predicted Zn-dependent protease
MTDRIQRFQALLDAGQDAPLLRLSLASALLDAGQADRALAQLERALELDPAYSAAWKLLGRTLLEQGEVARAAETLTRGIEVARARGDLQAAREMEVFARRAQRQLDGSAGGA